MAESPKRVPASKGDAPGNVKPTRATGETGRASDSSPVAPGQFASLPTQFGRYRIDKLLGKGQMGAVYLAYDAQLDRHVALKVARVSTAGSEKLIKRMETEAKAAAKIDHPLICKVYDFGEIDGTRYIALQYIEGEDLKSYLRRVGRCRQPDEAIRIILQLAGALEAAHEKGIIHRDLKPENVMMNRKGEPVIMDFGLAKRLTGSTDAGLTQGMIVGTAAYMSPEQAKGKAEGIDHRSDIYALGVMLFEMLTGEWPFDGSSIEVIGRKCVQEPPSPVEINANISPQLGRFCRKMIAQKKEDRFSNCAELIAGLEGINDNVEDIWELPDESIHEEHDHLQAPPPIPKSSKPKSLNSVNSRQKKPNTSPKALWILLGCAGLFFIGASALFFAFLRTNYGDSKTSPKDQLAATEFVQPQPPAIADSNDAKDRGVPKDRQSAVNSLTEQRSNFISITANDSPQEQEPTPPKSEMPEPAVTPDKEVMPDKEMVAATEPDSDPQPKLGNPLPDKPEVAAKTNSDVDDLIATAATLVKARQGKEAITALKKASKLDLKDIRPDFYLGLLHSGVGVNDPKVAEIHFKNVLLRSPGNIAALNNLALIDVIARNFEPARHHFTQAAETSPRPREINQNLGRFMLKVEQLRVPAKVVKVVGTLNASSKDFRSNTGWLYMPIDRSETAMNEYKSFCIDGALEDRSCVLCNGKGKMRCPKCGGMGYGLSESSSTSAMQTGIGVSSSTTVGTNRVPCLNCGGSKFVDCGGCSDGHDPTLGR